MASPGGTLRTGKYFGALVVLLGLLYLVVFFPGNRHTPKLGIDLVGGQRVIFQARTTNGSAPTSNAMDQARQIIEDRVNGQGVTGATVQVQNGNQLVVTIPGGTNTDVKELGEPAVLNFRGLMAPAQVVSCGTAASASTSASPSASSSASTSSSPSSTATSKANAKSGTSGSASAGKTATNAAFVQPLQAGGSGSATATSTAKAASSATATSTSTSSASASSTPSASGTSSAATSTKCESDPIGMLFKTDPGLKKVMPNAETCPSPALTSGATCHAYTSLSTTRKTELAEALASYDCSAAQNEPDKPDRYYIACDDGKQFGTKVAFLLGHVVVPGQEISSATAQAPGSTGTTTTSSWSVQLDLTNAGGNKWNAWTGKYHTDQSTASGVTYVQTSSTVPCGPSATVPCSDFVGFTLNGEVISSPITQATLDTITSISGDFTQSQADMLTQELNYGKLPLSFNVQSNESVSATLGSVQLKAAFLAGGIGLALVVLYSLAYYRGLGFVTIASLLVSAGFTYAMLVILGKQIGFTLDLAGIAGFIVALGITADSFVVFFERIKDEVHEGRSVRVAVPRAWIRARRTIISADVVSFAAAAILYFFAAADVKGFAFTLGMSTILDLVVVFLFTHPIVSLLSRSRTFGSPGFTGLNSVRTGPVIDDGEPAPRGPARAATGRTGSARERAAARRGVALREPAVTADDDEVGTETAPDGSEAPTTPGPTGRVDVTDSGATESGAATQGRPSQQRPSQGGTAAERAAARRARRRAQDTDGTTPNGDSEGGDA